MVSDLIDQHPEQFAVVTFNIDDTFEVPWGRDRFFNFYSFAFTPEMMFDGGLNCPSADYAACLGQRLGVGTDVTLTLSGTQISGSTWDIETDLCVEGGGPSRAMRVYTAATLSHRSGLPPYSRNLLMQEVPTQDVNLGSGNCQTITQRITFDGTSWSNQNDITIIAWAQEPNGTGPASVHQAAIMNWPFPAASELTTIVITPSSAELEVGENRSFTATGKDQFGADFSLSNPMWSMTGSGDGTFSPPSGNATTQFSATLPGELQITCTDGSVSGAASVVITGDPPALSEIVVSPSPAEMDVGQQKRFVASAQDQYGNPFFLSDPQWQAIGDGSGTFNPPSGDTMPMFTAVTPGAVQIICSEGDISGQASVVITGDPPHLDAMVISPETATVNVGASLVVTASGTDQYGDPFTPDNAVWSITGQGAGTLNPPTGAATTTLTATAAGSVVVTAQQDGIEATASVEITDEGLPKPRRIKARHTP